MKGFGVRGLEVFLSYYREHKLDHTTVYPGIQEALLILADEPTGNLDSHTGQEVLELIDTLNAQGKTIVLVTHDERIATRAHRVLHMRDGLIEREVANGHRSAGPDGKPLS